MTLIMSLCKSYMDPHLSRAALLLSTNSTDDGSSIPTFTLVIPVEPNDTCHTAGSGKKSAEPKKQKTNAWHPPTTLFSGGSGMMHPWSDCLTDSFS